VLDEKALLGWLDGKLARYKTPRRIVFWDEMPKSAYGKITKKMIREELETRDEQSANTLTA
jgi:fatty-acyl-CoA synthase